MAAGALGALAAVPGWLPGASAQTPPSSAGLTQFNPSAHTGDRSNTATDNQLSAERAEASRLASQIAAGGLRVQQLSEQVDAAILHQQTVAKQLAAARHREATTAAGIRSTRRLLQQQSVDTYMGEDGATAPLSDVSAQNNRVLALGYVETLGDQEGQTVARLAALLTSQVRDERSLRQEQAAAAISTKQLVASRTQVEAATTHEQATLDQVKGSLAPLVAAAEQAQQDQQISQTKHELAQSGELPAATPVDHVSFSSAAISPSSSDRTATVSKASAVRRTVTSVTTRQTTTRSVQDSRTAPPTQVTTTTRPAPPTTQHVTTTTQHVTTTTVRQTTTTTTAPPAANRSLASIVIAAAQAELGKPYVWAGAGPNDFDCSGLVMYVFAKAGIYFPHLAQSQYDETERVPIADLEPGDLVFFGTPNDVYHVGIYVGGGEMIDAPETGQVVSYQSIYWPTLLSGGRVS